MPKRPAIQSGDEARRLLDQGLALGTLEAESLRALAMLGLSGVLMVLLIAVVGYQSWSDPQFESRWGAVALKMGGILFLLGCYEGWLAYYLHRLSQAGKPRPSWIPYLTSAFEMGLHTFNFWIWANVSDPPALALGGTLSFIYFPFIFLTTLYLDFRLCFFTGLLAAAGFGLVSALIISSHPLLPGMESLLSPIPHGVKSILMLISGVGAGCMALHLKKQLVSSLEAARAHDRAVQVFGQHVSPEVAEFLLHQPLRATGELRRACVMFVDIRGFSGIAGASSPEQVMAYLNRLFEPLIEVVNEHGGIVNKFLGDGFMAIFGAPLELPNNSRAALHCALDILDRVRTLNTEPDFPLTKLGIGIHTGPTITGSVGSSQRQEYTLLGETVNLAARIEQATKEYSAQLLISEETLSEASMAELNPIEIGDILLRGQVQSIKLWKIC
ncbi:adenylate/guanylate cyclase domain-containing protein [soil metagenome]